MTLSGSLDGIRVIGVEHYISSPFCTQILADQGADVIKVEPIDTPDRIGYFQSFNRNKRSIALDLKSSDGQEALDALVRTSDVLITNFAAGVPERLGYGYERLAEINPRLIYVHITGFGLNSPHRQLPAFDGVIQAMSGMMHVTGEPDGAPMLSGLFIPDHLTGLWAALAISLALRRRDQTGEGSFTDLSMLDSMLTFQADAFAKVLDMHRPMERVGSKVRASYASTYRASDGYVYLAPLTAKMWEGVAKVIGESELTEYYNTADPNDVRLDHRTKLDALIEGWTSRFSVDHVVAQMRAAGVPSSSVYSIEDVAADPHLTARGMLRTVADLDRSKRLHVPGSPIPCVDDSFDVPPPSPGEHTDEILAELGLDSSARVSGAAV